MRHEAAAQYPGNDEAGTLIRKKKGPTQAGLRISEKGTSQERPSIGNDYHAGINKSERPHVRLRVRERLAEGVGAITETDFLVGTFRLVEVMWSQTRSVMPSCIVRFKVTGMTLRNSTIPKP
jgi:hypothetical protein